MATLPHIYTHTFTYTLTRLFCVTLLYFFFAFLFGCEALALYFVGKNFRVGHTYTHIHTHSQTPQRLFHSLGGTQHASKIVENTVTGVGKGSLAAPNFGGVVSKENIKSYQTEENEKSLQREHTHTRAHTRTHSRVPRNFSSSSLTLLLLLLLRLPLFSCGWYGRTPAPARTASSSSLVVGGFFFATPAISPRCPGLPGFRFAGDADDTNTHAYTRATQSHHFEQHGFFITACGTGREGLVFSPRFFPVILAKDSIFHNTAFHATDTDNAHTQRRTHASMLYTFHQSRGVDGTRNCSFSCVIATGFKTQASLFTLLFDFHDGSNCEILHVESSYNL